MCLLSIMKWDVTVTQKVVEMRLRQQSSLKHLVMVPMSNCCLDDIMLALDSDMIVFFWLYIYMSF